MHPLPHGIKRAFLWPVWAPFRQCLPLLALLHGSRPEDGDDLADNFDLQQQPQHDGHNDGEGNPPSQGEKTAVNVDPQPSIKGENHNNVWSASLCLSPNASQIVFRHDVFKKMMLALLPQIRKPLVFDPGGHLLLLRKVQEQAALSILVYIKEPKISSIKVYGDQACPLANHVHVETMQRGVFGTAISYHAHLKVYTDVFFAEFLGYSSVLSQNLADLSFPCLMFIWQFPHLRPCGSLMIMVIVGDIHDAEFAAGFNDGNAQSVVRAVVPEFPTLDSLCCDTNDGSDLIIRNELLDMSWADCVAALDNCSIFAIYLFGWIMGIYHNGIDADGTCIFADIEDNQFGFHLHAMSHFVGFSYGNEDGKLAGHNCEMLLVLWMLNILWIHVDLGHDIVLYLMLLMGDFDPGGVRLHVTDHKANH